MPATSQRKSAAAEVVAHLVTEFPTAPALTLAKRAYREHPELWPNLEACRSAFRGQLGVMGEKKRKQTPDKKHYRKPRPAGWTDVIPEALVQLGEWKAVEVPGPHRALILSDVHLPYHSMEALQLALEYGEKRKPTLILLNGDLFDFYAISRWETNPKMRDFPAEVRAGKFFLGGLRKRFPKARIIFREGNHEERWEKYLRLKAPDLLGLPDFEWESVYGLEEFRIERIGDKRPVRLGELNTLHGHEYVFAISNPVNPARGLFLRAKCHALCGHFHQPAQHSEKNVEQKLVTTWSTGCLCDLTPEYRPLNPWGHGFAFVEIGKDGSFAVDNLRIVNGKVW